MTADAGTGDAPVLSDYDVKVMTNRAIAFMLYFRDIHGDEEILGPQLLEAAETFDQILRYCEALRLSLALAERDLEEKRILLEFNQQRLFGADMAFDAERARAERSAAEVVRLHEATCGTCRYFPKDDDGAAECQAGVGFPYRSLTPYPRHKYFSCKLHEPQSEL